MLLKRTYIQRQVIDLSFFFSWVIICLLTCFKMRSYTSFSCGSLNSATICLSNCM